MQRAPVYANAPLCALLPKQRAGRGVCAPASTLAASSSHASSNASPLQVSRGTISATARVSNVQACECLLRRDADENPHTEHASLVDRAVAPNVAFGGDASPFATPPRAGAPKGPATGRRRWASDDPAGVSTWRRR